MPSPFSSVVFALALVTPRADAAKLDDLLAPTGWEVAGDAEHKVLGDVVLETKDVAGVKCLKGTASVDTKPATMVAVVEDVDGAMGWSTAGLIATRKLADRNGTLEYYQHLGIPDWTGAADRYWVLRSQTSTRADGTKVFTWDRFDWRAAYPDLATELDRDYPKAIEPEPNFGAWVFVPQGGGARLEYYLCTASGKIPYWLQKAAATKTLPGAMADVVVEARKRGN
ncbi:MAG: hypothetical protein H6742_08695 [Alphaproteobacteria bacterium]|nr:hypothetical protein [Alphaproteobacteria bacterium]